MKCSGCIFLKEMITHTFAVNDTTIDRVGPLPEDKEEGCIYKAKDGSWELEIQFSYETKWLECRVGPPKENTGFQRHKGWPQVLADDGCGSCRVRAI
ncbi:MAG: hypothetical protein JRD68_00060 [Deltaproteobacteria bacterium]|nr:hypothetical protein [Deltaproteobacteria bacterium]